MSLVGFICSHKRLVIHVQHLGTPSSVLCLAESAVLQLKQSNLAQVSITQKSINTSKA